MRKAFVAALPKIPVAAQVAELTAAGITDRDIYIDGRGAESLSACLAAFRGRPGELVIAADLRVFGESRKAILDQLAMLERLKITVHDIANKETSQPLMMDRALSALADYKRWKGSKKVAASSGRRGGRAKGDAAAEARNAIMREDIIRRLCAAPELPWKRKVEILGEPFTLSTLRRHYAKK